MPSLDTTSSTCLQQECSELCRKKEDSIRHCLAAPQNTVDLWQLRDLALTRGGLVNAELRQKAWHILVGLECIDNKNEPNNNKCCSSLDEKEMELIRCDAGRSVLFRYHRRQQDDETVVLPSGESTSQHDLSYRDQQEQLESVLVATLSGKKSKSLYYYQGLHDIAGVLLHNVQDANHASAILKQLVRVHLRDAMRKDLHSLIAFSNVVVMPLLDAIDAELADFLQQSGFECSNAILPWLITWFTHDLHEEQVASRLVDAFLSAHALFPLYFAVALLVHPRNRSEIFQADFDPASIHMVMKSLTCHICNDWTCSDETSIAAQDLIDDAITFMRKHPPRSLMTLAREYGCEDPQSCLNVAASVMFLRAPPSWAMAATMTLPTQNDKENVDTRPDKNVVLTCRAKCASGVPFVMSAVDETTVLSKRLADKQSSSSSCSPCSVLTQWELCQRTFFGRFSTEDSCASLFGREKSRPDSRKLT